MLYQHSQAAIMRRLFVWFLRGLLRIFIRKNVFLVQSLHRENSVHLNVSKVKCPHNQCADNRILFMNAFLIPETFVDPDKRLIRSKYFDLKQVNKIVIRGIDPLGDLAIGSAFFREARRQFPQAHITNLINRHGYELMQDCPYIDECIPFSSKESKKDQWRVIKKLQQGSYDLALLLSGNIHAALAVYLAKIPNRVGYDSDGRGFLLTVRLHKEFHDRYRGENHFDLLRALGLNPVDVFKRHSWVSEQTQSTAQKIIREINPEQKTLLAFNPFAKDYRRTWPSSYWVDLIQQLLAKNFQPVALVGPGESSPAQALLQTFDGRIPIVEQPITVAAAILRNCRWVVATDSGFMHLALSVDGPSVIGLFGLLAPDSSFPINDSHHQALIVKNLACCPCNLVKSNSHCYNPIKCMEGLTPKDIMNTIERIQRSVL